jgi:hypothetical protein
MDEELVEDDLIFPAIVKLVSCLEAAIQDRNLPTPCSIGPILGDLTLDYCGNCSDKGCGQAWVRLVDTFPSIEFPTIDGSLRNCVGVWAFTLEIGIVRCKPVGKTTGVRGYVPPSTQQIVDALRVQTADIRAMRAAIQCCFASEDQPYVISTYTPGSPDGDCLGGVFNVIVGQVF